MINTSYNLLSQSKEEIKTSLYPLYMTFIIEKLIQGIKFWN